MAHELSTAEICKRGPQGTERRHNGWIVIPLHDGRAEWSLQLIRLHRGRRRIDVKCEIDWGDARTTRWLNVGEVYSLNQVIWWYELLSGKRWPASPAQSVSA